MNSASWTCYRTWIKAASCILAEPDREAVLGDLAESGEGFLSSLQSVFGLALRRHLERWTTWRPWATSLGLALPSSLFLMGNSVAATQNLADLTHHSSDSVAPLPSILKLALVLCWAWIAGFSVATLSPKTLWASALAAMAPCLLCITEWPGTRLSALRLLLFLAPAICGVLQGLRSRRLNLTNSILLAASAVFLPSMWTTGGSFCTLGMLWPAIFLIVRARQNPT